MRPPTSGWPATPDTMLDWFGMALWDSSVSDDCLEAGVVSWSAGGAALAGMPGPGPHPFSRFLDLVHIDDRLRVLNELGRGRAAPVMALEFRLLLPGKAARRMGLRVVLGETPTGSPKRAVGVLWDADWIVALSTGAVPDQALAAKALAAIPHGIIATDIHACITYMNPAAERLTGFPGKAALGSLIERALHVQRAGGAPENDCAVLRCLRLQHAVDGFADSVLATDDGRRIAVALSAAPIRGGDGALAGAVLSVRDVSHERKVEQQLSWKASHDALTGLLNRSEFEARLGAACHAALADDQQHAVLFMDLDRFKIVNDTCGHCAGDLLLQQLTKMLLSHMRDSDTLARLGGDELGVLLLHCPLEKALRVADSLRQAVGDFRFAWEAHAFQLGISIGIAGIDSGAGLAADVLSQADQACYVAKKSGRNCIHQHQLADFADGQRQDKQEWLTTLREAFIHNDFRLYAMPVMTLRTSGASHEDILVRLYSSVSGILLPGAFLPAAKRYDLMASIDRWVVAAVCRSLRQRQQGRAAALPLCSVKLSHAALDDPDFAAYVTARFHEYQVAPSGLCFEIGEAALQTRPHAVRALVNTLHDLGCRFALDHFSGAVASFVCIKTLPISYLKIDSNLVRATASDPLHRVMVRAINDVAHAMGIKTVAGYVDDAAILAAIDEIGIDYALGHAVGHARPLGQASH